MCLSSMASALRLCTVNTLHTTVYPLSTASSLMHGNTKYEKTHVTTKKGLARPPGDSRGARSDCGEMARGDLQHGLLESALSRGIRGKVCASLKRHRYCVLRQGCGDNSWLFVCLFVCYFLYRTLFPKKIYSKTLIRSFSSRLITLI